MLVPGGGIKKGQRPIIDDEIPCGSVVDAARDSMYCPSTSKNTSSSSPSPRKLNLPRPAPRVQPNPPTPKPRSGKITLSHIIWESEY